MYSIRILGERDVLSGVKCFNFRSGCWRYVFIRRCEKNLERRKEWRLTPPQTKALLRTLFCTHVCTLWNVFFKVVIIISVETSNWHITTDQAKFGLCMKRDITLCSVLERTPISGLQRHESWHHLLCGLSRYWNGVGLFITSQFRISHAFLHWSLSDRNIGGPKNTVCV